MEWVVGFDKLGNHCAWEHDHNIYKTIPPYEFNETLVFKGYSRGRSSFNIEWQSSTGKTYVSGMPMLEQALKESRVRGNKVQGTFYFKKQGQSVLLHLKPNK